MNSKFKSLLAMGMISAIAAENGYYGGKNEYVSIPKSNPEYKRKKCKSCASYRSSLKWGKCAYPNNQACENYVKRKK